MRLTQAVKFDAGQLQIKGHPTFYCAGFLPIVSSEVNLTDEIDAKANAVVKDVGIWLVQVGLVDDPNLAMQIAREDFFNFAVRVFPGMTKLGNQTKQLFILVNRSI
jgi:hypothetical protein